MDKGQPDSSQAAPPVDALKSLALDHGEPAVASLIDVDSEPPTPTNEAQTTKTGHEQSAPSNSPLVTLKPQPPTYQGDLLPTIEERRETLQSREEHESTAKASSTSNLEDATKRDNHNCSQCDILRSELDMSKAEKSQLIQEIASLKSRLLTNKEELEREVQKRVELEQRFTEEAKRTTDQIEELIAKSESDDSKLNELKNQFELYSRETSSMIENFTTNRELLASQLLELRKENDFFLGRYLSKARDLQSADIDLPQTIEELQFHCLTLNEKLILATMAKERLEETVMMSAAAAAATTPTPQPPPATSVPTTTA